MRDDERQLDKEPGETLEESHYRFCGEMVSKTNGTSWANTANQLLYELNCPHNNINQDG